METKEDETEAEAEVDSKERFVAAMVDYFVEESERIEGEGFPISRMARIFLSSAELAANRSFCPGCGESGDEDEIAEYYGRIVRAFVDEVVELRDDFFERGRKGRLLLSAENGH